MKQQRQKVLLTLVFMTFFSAILIVYKSHNAYSLHSILRSRKGLGEQILPNIEYIKIDIEDTHPEAIINNDVECDNDYILEVGHSWTGRIKQKESYLEHRRFCILKYCGEVCNTTKDFQNGKTYI